MRNHAFHHYNSGKTMLSASGTIYPASYGTAAVDSDSKLTPSESFLVLTVASVIEPFVSQPDRESMSKVQDKPRLIPGAQIDILMGKSMIDGDVDALPWLPAELIKMVNIPQSSAAVQSLIEASCGSLENSWEVGWSLASHSSGPQHLTDGSRAQVIQSSFPNRWPLVRMESSNPILMGQSATRVALLAIPSKYVLDSPKLQMSIPKRGDLLLAMGSPFGILSPLHFFNNISVGSIGNSYPPGSFTRSLLMADIRCLPGMEGSPVFSDQSGFIGLLTRPLRQKISGTEIQMVIPWEAIISACNDLEEPDVAHKENNNDIGKMNSGEESSKGLVSPVEKAINSICLITTDDGSWASGVLLNKQGLVLTNAHLLEPWRFGKTVANSDRNETGQEAATLANIHLKHETCSGIELSQNLHPKNVKAADNSMSCYALTGRSSSSLNHKNIRVRLDFMDPWMWTDAKMVYISKGPLDVALLQLEVAPDQLCPIVVDVHCPPPGSKAFVIGHGLFGPRCDFLPSACLGVIAKVIETTRSSQSVERFPAMLETTAAVHPGSSGGAVVNSDGCMIGLVTSNAKHGGGTVIPHLNFSIPCAALEPIMKFAKDMKDPSFLEELEKPNENLSSVWALMPPLYPKPAPSPQLPADGDNKGPKGSRFAKFLADRNALLKSSSAATGKDHLSSKL
ncbi:glyoxysomal processing protease, glyoxysomal isoform X2 [Andrographis paniculata]|nr:glyoxysomal processing protease, glyoxysomal isoform X2 [Andrographis paniculata]